MILDAVYFFFMGWLAIWIPVSSVAVIRRMILNATKHNDD